MVKEVQILLNRVFRPFYRLKFKQCGKNVKWSVFDDISYHSVVCGDNVYIGRGAKFSARHSEIKIGDNVMFGPNVTIRGGNHNIGEIGQVMFEVKVKSKSDDKGVTIHSDVWIGTGSILLSGSIVNTGAILAAGSVLTKEIPEYEIWGGVPARKIRSRFNPEELIEHKAKMLKMRYA